MKRLKNKPFVEKSSELLEAIRADMLGDGSGGWSLSMAAARNGSKADHIREWAKECPECQALLQMGSRKPQARFR